MRVGAQIEGQVQGVGFRPFVHRLATQLGLSGWVANTARGVELEVVGGGGAVRRFLAGLEGQAPSGARIHGLHSTRLRGRPFPARGFEIRPSRAGGSGACTPPDFAPCARCVSEMRNPADRRFRHPFIACAHCGPRHSLVEALPYDRERSTLARFPLCEACLHEYEDPSDRRFHAQGIGCHACGPRLVLLDRAGSIRGRDEAALSAALRALAEGAVVAVKGVGGFQLLTDATSPEAVLRLRRRKQRPGKPFAVMVADLARARALAQISEAEAALLTSPAAPITLLRPRGDGLGRVPGLAASVGMVGGDLGLMLPASPLHHLLVRDFGAPLVATSGNRSGEPIVLEEDLAREHLGGIADLFLSHDRAIARRVDDSVARVIDGRPMILRRARGYAPVGLEACGSVEPALALGGQLKATVALSRDRRILPSAHIGDLDQAGSREGFAEAVRQLEAGATRPTARVLCDLHPDYASTHFARERIGRSGGELIQVQHHHAHVMACVAEHGLATPILGVAWDGSGYGPDGTLWGGEFLEVGDGGHVRVAHLRPFGLPGGDRCAREPARVALGLLHAHGEIPPDLAASLVQQIGGRGRPDRAADETVLRRMLETGVNCPTTSSVGRLFDAVAALVGLGEAVSFEAEAAMRLEYSAREASTAGGAPAGPYVFRWIDPPPEAGGPAVLDWAPALDRLLADLRAGAEVGAMALAFHDGLAEAVHALAVARSCREIVLAGGCFQNALLLEGCIRRLRASGIEPHWSRQVPIGDGGLAVGQLEVLAHRDRLRGGP